MPEFRMNKGSLADARRFADLPLFVQGYIEALLFTNTEQGPLDPENGSALPETISFADFAPSALIAINADCERFQAENAPDLATAYEFDNYDETRAGGDFWYTRNGHGVGYWDRGLGDAGDRLSDACERFPQSDPYLGDDERVYLT